MIPVNQTLFGGKEGNCFEACLASIMEVPIEIFPGYKDADWLALYNRFLGANFGLQLLLIAGEQHQLFKVQFGMDCHHLISGQGPRGLKHSVVGLNGRMVHDPHPDGSGLVEVDTWDFLVRSYR